MGLSRQIDESAAPRSAGDRGCAEKVIIEVFDKGWIFGFQGGDISDRGSISIFMETVDRYNLLRRIGIF